MVGGHILPHRHLRDPYTSSRSLTTLTLTRTPDGVPTSFAYTTTLFCGLDDINNQRERERGFCKINWRWRGDAMAHETRRRRREERKREASI
jgi:hypothetical protein